jgi:hypothetical protein
MQTCFHEAFRILKAGHWMTVVFSNTQTAVWQSLKTNKKSGMKSNFYENSSNINNRNA